VRSEIPLSYSPLSKRGDRGDFPLYQRGLPAVRQGACSGKGIPTLPACRQAGVGVPLHFK